MREIFRLLFPKFFEGSLVFPSQSALISLCSSVRFFFSRTLSVCFFFFFFVSFLFCFVLFFWSVFVFVFAFVCLFFLREFVRMLLVKQLRRS